jgi:membrane fusion protein, heavy metal efflux system
MSDAVEVQETEEAPGSSWVAWAMAAFVIVGLAVVLWLLPHPHLTESGADPREGSVIITEHRTIKIRAGTPFSTRLKVVEALAKQTDQAMLEVTGTVLAAVPPGPGAAHGWQFASPDLVATYSEWLQSEADVAFGRRQATTARDLAQTRVRTQSEVVDRLSRLVEVGSDSARDLALEQANLMEKRLEADQQTHEAEATWHAAERRHAALERQLEQAGLSPKLLLDPAPGRVLLVAEVPETRITTVRENQRSSARFYAAPDTAVNGHVASILPTVSAAHRTLRLVVLLDGAPEIARPGMFADVGVGTDARTAVIVPARSIVHIGREDVVLSALGPDEWKVTRVSLGRSEHEDVEVVQGIGVGEKVMSDGVVLLKPVIADILNTEAEQ